MKGFIVDTDYTDDEECKVHLFGRLENKESFVATIKFHPYFFVKEKDKDEIKKISSEATIEETKLTTFKSEKVLKIICKTQAQLNKILKEIHELEIDTFEADIKPHTRYIIDNNLKGTIEVQGDYTSSEKIDRVYANPEILPSKNSPKLKVLSIDIEFSEEKLFCIGMYSENYEKVFIITEKRLQDAISCKDEEDCLEKFKQEFLKFDPDIIVGWNIIDFDLNHLHELFKKHKIKFDLGRTNEPSRLKIESDFFRTSSANLIGRQVIDGLSLIQDPFIQEAPSIKNAKFESYTLENVSQQVLGKGKSIKGENKCKEIEELFNSQKSENLKKLADYNLLDCKLVYEILEKTKMIELAIERSELTGMTLDRLTASIASFDSVYIREARKRNLVSPTLKFGLKETKLKGGYVHSEKYGIFHNVLVLDFKSLYPSIIKTFNIDPASYLGQSTKEKKVVESPNKVYFKNTNGILPEIISELHDAREKAKKEKRELSSFAIKIIMNSFWGVLASPNCRYFDFNMASAITSFARMIIQLTAQKIEEKGLQVIYSDTDSVFVQTNLGEKETEEKAKELQDYINNFYRKYVSENYKRESFLDLEYKKQYLSMMIPSLRKTEEENQKAAKKRYAGLIRNKNLEELEVVGLEAIRGDWTEAAGNFQKELLLKVFKNQRIEEFIKNYVKKILEGKIDEELVYRKSMRKKLEEYTKTTPPHVKAARKLPSLNSTIIEYYMTTDGPEPIQKLTHKIDYEHYIEKQIKPIANQILNLFNKNFDDIIKGSKQKTLF